MPDQIVHILYVDDDVPLVRLVEKACRRRGYFLTHAETVPAALERLAAGDISLVVLDHDLRTETGLDLLAAIRGLPVRPPVIYVTGSADTSVAVAALKAGALDYVWKSAAGDFMDLLFAGIEPALERGRLERARIRAENDMRAARERAELLLGEVNHRIANSLALVASLVRMQAGLLTDPAAIDALAETQARIHAIGGVHRRLYTSTDVGRVALDGYLRDLVADLRSGFQDEGRTARITLAAEPTAATTDQAVAVGVAVTELITNAIKYAYPEGTPGEIRVFLRKAGEGARITVEDDGIGWNGQGAIKGSGLGTRIVRAMMVNLDSALSYDPDAAGTRVSFDFRTCPGPNPA